MPDHGSYSIFSDPLGLTVWMWFAVCSAGICVVRFHNFRIWISQRWIPLTILGLCFLVGFLVSWISPRALYWLSLDAQFKAQRPPDAVSGSDLIASLLMLTALTASAGFSYLCLPPDR